MLAHKHGLLFYEDQGSGALLPDDILVRGGEETTPASVSAGLDLVSCSGDKLLGAAQAGIIMGRRDLVQACGSHPLMRALRPGKLALTALEATLRIYMDGADVAHREVPVLNMLTLPQAHLERRARSCPQVAVCMQYSLRKSSIVVSLLLGVKNHVPVIVPHCRRAS